MKMLSYITFAVGLVFPALLNAQAKQIPLDALNYIHFLKKADFDARFPGVALAANTRPTSEGYYIVYTHESLTYYFGPTEDTIIAEVYKQELDRIVAEVQSMRSHLDSARTYLIQIPEERSTPSEKTNTPPEQSTEEPTSSPQQEQEDSQPWWKRLFRALGF